jgi:hypothetical protein
MEIWVHGDMGAPVQGMLQQLQQLIKNLNCWTLQSLKTGQFFWQRQTRQGQSLDLQ